MESANAARGRPATATEFATPLAPLSGERKPGEAGERGQPSDLLRRSPEGQRQVLVDLLRAGENDAAIGARYRLSQWQVRNLRYRLGIRKDRGGNVHIAPRGSRGTEIAPVNVALQMAGNFDSGDLSRRLSALGALVEAAPASYRVQVQIEQTARG